MDDGKKSVLTLANLLTLCRLVGSWGLLFLSVSSTAFWLIYIFCGVTDMFDGPLARNTHTASRAGAVLDSIADLSFVLICLYKILPAVTLSSWSWFWIGGIVLLRFVNVLIGFFTRKRILFLHTPANKITGAFLFLTPLALLFIRPGVVISAACILASFASVQESVFLLRKKSYHE